jgi:hypothetical protein
LLYWQLVELSVACEVVAPTLVPVKAGDRVKTDRRDRQRGLSRDRRPHPRPADHARQADPGLTRRTVQPQRTPSRVIATRARRTARPSPANAANAIGITTCVLGLRR